ncbi:MAG TPA: 6-bladed beta-propeller [Longimicrobium sp.]|nr:6-bladed beta-propeller [Longimicrobium sp.]
MNSHPVRRAVLALFLTAVPLAAAGAQQVVRLPEQDRPLAGRVPTVFSVGAMEGQSWEMLSNAEQAVFDRADNLYVLDRGNARVLVFDRAGRFVRQLGRKGGGPGELEVPVSVAVLADGSVAVLDLAHQNVSLFGADGRFRRTVPWNQGWGLGRAMAGEPRGGVLALLRPGLSPEALRSGNPPRTQTISRVALAGNGAATRLLEIPDATVVQTSGSNSGNQRSFNVRMLGPPEFSPLTLWGVLPGGGLALTHTQLYTVKVYDATGRPVRVIQRPVRVRRPTARDRERARERMRAQLRSGRGMVMVTRQVGGPGGGGAPPRGSGGGLPPEQIEQRVREMQFADTVRTIQGMTVTSSGKLWIERTPPNIGAPGPIDVVTADGRYLGTVTGIRLPTAISATGRAAWLERDEDDVERVVVRQLPAGWF